MFFPVSVKNLISVALLQEFLESFERAGLVDRPRSQILGLDVDKKG